MIINLCVLCIGDFLGFTSIRLRSFAVPQSKFRTSFFVSSCADGVRVCVCLLLLKYSSRLKENSMLTAQRVTSGDKPAVWFAAKLRNRTEISLSLTQITSARRSPPRR